MSTYERLWAFMTFWSDHCPFGNVLDVHKCLLYVRNSSGQPLMTSCSFQNSSSVPILIRRSASAILWQTMLPLILSIPAIKPMKAKKKKMVLALLWLKKVTGEFYLNRVNWNQLTRWNEPRKNTQAPKYFISLFILHQNTWNVVTCGLLCYSFKAGCRSSK